MPHVISTKHAKAWRVYSKKSNTQKLEYKVKRLVKIAAKYPFIPLNTKNLKTFVLSHPKDYSFIVLFTSLKEGDGECETCQYYYEEYKTLANSFKRSPAYKTNQIFIGAIDFKNNEDVFEMLSITTTPMIMHFPPMGIQSAEDIMDFKKWGCSAVDMSKWIEERTDIKITLKSRTGLLLSIYQCIKDGLAPRNMYRNLVCNKDIWACSMVLFSFDMVAGENWITEHNPPRFTFNKKKGVQFIYKNDMHYQFVYETYLVAILHLLVAVGMCLTIEALRGKKKDRSLRSVIGVIIIFIFFAALQAVFRMKESHYPFFFIFL